jgi:two-component system OmpR family sensor kinase
VEDEPDLLNGLVRALRRVGYAVDPAPDGEEGLYKAQTVDYDAIVLDVMLPRLDGWELLGRLDAEQEPLHREHLDLAAVARGCVELVRPLATERGIEIQCALDSPAACCGDAGRLSQVITNLLTNAIQYSHERGQVRVAAGTEDGAAVLTVTDNGPGIAPEDLPRVFDRFYRGGKSRTARPGHAGLGLAIAKAIIEAHGGARHVLSPPGAGATFTLRLS